MSPFGVDFHPLASTFVSPGFDFTFWPRFSPFFRHGFALHEVIVDFFGDYEAISVAQGVWRLPT
jgi:hypothetical protein